jgi:hypothetical protein
MHYWHRKYLQSPVLYEGRSLFMNNGVTISRTVPISLDVRHFIQADDFYLNRIVKDAGIWDLDTDEEIALACLRYTRKNVGYTPDKMHMGVNEFWMFPNETLSLGHGDCEDQAIAVKDRCALHLEFRGIGPLVVAPLELHELSVRMATQLPRGLIEKDGEEEEHCGHAQGERRGTRVFCARCA